jgi:hypothetical protein
MKISQHIVIIIFALLLACILFNDADAQLLVGYTADEISYTQAPSSNDLWKAIRTQAEATGSLDTFKVEIGDDGGITDAAVCWAIYTATSTTEAGVLMAYGTHAHYDFTVIGDEAVHSFARTHTVTTDQITSGTWYWYTWYTTANNNVLIGRGAVGECVDPTYKTGTNDGINTTPDAQGYLTPPSADQINDRGMYGPGCYAWGIFAGGGAPDPGAVKKSAIIIDISD